MSSNIKEELSEAYKKWEKEVETVSSCCGYGHYEENLICENCGEHCSAEPEMPFNEWVEEEISSDCGYDQVIAND